MTEPTYRIKPLEWTGTGRERRGYVWCGANTNLISFAVSKEPIFGWRWVVFGVEPYQWEKCDSLEDGKAKAEAFYLSRILPALELVEDGEE